MPRKGEEQMGGRTGSAHQLTHRVDMGWVIELGSADKSKVTLYREF